MNQSASRLNPITVAIVSFFGFVALVLAMSAYQMGTLQVLQDYSAALHAVHADSLLGTEQSTSAERTTDAANLRRISNAMSRVQSLHAGHGKQLSSGHRQVVSAAISAFASLPTPSVDAVLLLDSEGDQKRMFAIAIAAAIDVGDAALKKRINLLRWFQWFALAAGALLLAGLVLHLFRNLGQEEQAVASSQQETKHILSTVSEGLFLLDKNLKIGAEFSAVAPDILRRTDLAGLSFEQLLKEMVPERTQSLALDFVRLLWSDHVEPELVDDINPLGEVEVHLRNAGGQYDTRHLKFGFKRVSTQADGEILVSVTDISDGVKMRQDLEKARAESEAQMDLLMSILHVDAGQLQAFLADSVASLNSVNAVMQSPASKHEEFKEKIDNIFRTVHSIKSDAAALGLPSIESKAHNFEDDLQALRSVAELGGRDLLGLPIKLDDLLSHFASIESLVGRVTSLRSAFSAPVAASSAQPAAGLPAKAAATPSVKTNAATPDVPQFAATQRLNPGSGVPKELDLETHLNAVVTRVGGDLQKQVALQCRGFEHLPASMSASIKEALVQLLRNAVVHGLEAPAERTQRGKGATGTIAVTCIRDQGGIELRIEDDGAGISAGRIRHTAVARKLVTTEEAAQLAGSKLLALLFRPGFSTAEAGNPHAGRGVGLDVVVDSVKRIGGRVGLSTKPGAGTRFTIKIPLADARHAA